MLAIVSTGNGDIVECSFSVNAKAGGNSLDTLGTESTFRVDEGGLLMPAMRWIDELTGYRDLEKS